MINRTEIARKAAYVRWYNHQMTLAQAKDIIRRELIQAKISPSRVDAASVTKAARLIQRLANS